MLITLKFIHFFAIATGLGGSFFNIVTGVQSRAAPAAAAPMIGALRRRIGQIIFLSLLVLWVSGLWLLALRFTSLAEVPSIVWGKLAVVLVLTAISVRLQFLSIAAARAGTPPPATIMARLGAAGAVLATLAVLVAVVAFSD